MIRRRLPLTFASVTCEAMRATVLILLSTLVFDAARARAVAPLYDPVALNVGINCHWEQLCERRQLKAMNTARRFISHKHPALWRVHLCNKNARRGTARLDWIGFDHCIRNPNLLPIAEAAR
jgi:hypothetical protein